MAALPGFLRPPAWTNQDLILYHGTVNFHVSSIRERVDVTRGKPKRDFGRGFYTTTKRRQARSWAWNAVAESESLDPSARGRVRPMVVRFRVDREAFAGLGVLSFVRADDRAADFWSFVHHCRSDEPGHGRPVPPNRDGWYDVVVGPVAAFWETSLVIADSDQFSFHTPRAADLLDRSLAGVERVA